MIKVFVYWNLHKKCWSIKDVVAKKVIAHRNSVRLTDCQFKVSEAGRQRVIREKRKNVHAGVVGNWVDDVPRVDLPREFELVRYNPYEMANFQCLDRAIHEAKEVRMFSGKLVYAAVKL